MFDPMTAADAQRVTDLTAEFVRIGETMKDIGLYHHPLRVEPVSFRRWENWLCGVLVTPWFMNFMLLPTDPAQLSGLSVGDRHKVEMPRGEVTFVVGEVEGIGLYLASSLYSPMGRFDVQDVAVSTAQTAVDKYFKTPEAEEPLACNDRT